MKCPDCGRVLRNTLESIQHFCNGPAKQDDQAQAITSAIEILKKKRDVLITVKHPTRQQELELYKIRSAIEGGNKLLEQLQKSGR